MARITTADIAATAAAATLSLGGERRLDRRRDAIDGIGLLDHRRVVELGWRRIDVSARRNDERHILLAQLGRHRPNVLTLQIDVEDGEVETALLHLVQRALHRLAGAADLMSERIEKILEHHSDERLI